MEQADKLIEDINNYEAITKKLSIAVNKSGVEWKDTQFKRFSEKMSSIARASKEIIAAGGKVESSIRLFERIESE